MLVEGMDEVPTIVYSHMRLLPPSVVLDAGDLLATGRGGGYLHY